MSDQKTTKYCSIGGQALIEGIMMTSLTKTAVCVRTPDGDIYQEYLEPKKLKDYYDVFKYPFFRGVAAFVDAMKVGYKALMLSAKKSGLDDELEEETNSKKNKSSEKREASEQTSKDEKTDKEEKEDSKLVAVVSAVSSIVGIAISVLLFFFLPTFLFNQFSPVTDSLVVRSVSEGILRILIFICYLALCSKIPYMGRLFAYHGAEHKTIFCYESKRDLTVENVKKFRRFHPRCGTSFIIISLLIGIIIGFFIPIAEPILRSCIKILCLPIVLGGGYEILRICGKYDNKATRILAAPGLWVQRLTTKEPEDDMIEVAIQALNAVAPENKSEGDNCCET